MNWDKVRKEFETSDVSMADLAKKHNVKPSTLRSRKNREDWQRNATEKVTQHKVETSQRDATQKKPNLVIENDSLTEQQKLFCLYYIKSLNATQSYMKAYQCSWETANARSYLLLGNVGVKGEIDRLQADMQQDLYIDAKRILSEYAKQASSDINDYLEYGTKEVELVNEFGEPIIDEETGKQKVVRRNYVSFKESDEVDGTLIQEVKMGKDGPVIKLMDKQKAMDALMKYVDFDALKVAQIDKAVAEARLAEQKLELIDNLNSHVEVVIVDDWGDDFEEVAAED